MTLRMAEAWGVHPSEVESGSYRWYLRYIIDKNAQIKAQKKNNG